MTAPRREPTTELGSRPVHEPDEEFERLKRRHNHEDGGVRRLGVLNTAPAGGTPPFALEDDGAEPGAEIASLDALRDEVIAAIRTVHDPEIPLNIYDLGLVYDVDVESDRSIHVRMTLTAPGCPVAGSLVKEVQEKVRGVPGVSHAKTELVWDPPWSRERMSFEARLELGLI
jgi:FeS assembly SUF system protein